MSLFVPAARRPLPVILIADTSGSMKGEKIATLNHALRNMVSELANLHDIRGEVYVSLVTFGGEPRLVSSLVPADQMQLPELVAGGKTPLGAALDLVRGMLEDESMIPTRAFFPSLVLLSDGAPTDVPEELKGRILSGEVTREDFLSWEPVATLHSSRLGMKAQRLALAVGVGDESKSNKAVLEAFVHTLGTPVIGANDPGGIARFLRWVTLSVATRTRSRDPNTPVLPSLSPFDNDEIIF